LYKSFDAKGRQDSSNKYYRLAGNLKDSLLSTEKVRAIEAISFSSLLRQQELDAEKIKAEDERKQNIQYALIALGIITFLILFFLLSRSIVVTEKWISFFGILGLLIVFEFINLLIHPFLERVTHHSPILMLLALVVIASLLIPIHHRIENWIKDKMTKKNKTIRLEHAKKTIEDLEIKAIKTKEENE
jgi:CDP-diglyceride synthetase